MKLSDVKAAILTAAAENTEAFTEISNLITTMQAQIDALIAGQSDPDITDADFLASLQTLSDNAKKLADIVPNPPTDVPDAAKAGGGPTGTGTS